MRLEAPSVVEVCCMCAAMVEGHIVPVCVVFYGMGGVIGEHIY